MTLEQLNAADSEIARAALLRCCGSQRWADSMLVRRPFENHDALHALAASIWWTLDPPDWLEAFSVHPKIGDKKRAGKWSSDEQSGIDGAQAAVLARIAKANEDYERRFGWVFLVNATGRTAADILACLETRLPNDKATELRVAAGEQAQITALRLDKLMCE